MAKKLNMPTINKIVELKSKINLRAYNKELKRLRRAVKRIESRGYEFTKLPFKELKKPLPSSIERLQQIKAKDLYKYTVYETEQGIIRGTERRKQERRESARKAVETRKRNKQRFSQETLQTQSISVSTPQEQFEEQQHKRDEEAKRKLEQDRKYREKFSQAKLMYNEIMDMIYDIDITHQRSAESLRNELDNQLDRYGEDAVFMSMANASDEFLETCRTALRYDPETEQHLLAITHLRELITGEIPTMEEMQAMHDMAEQDSYYNGI